MPAVSTVTDDALADHDAVGLVEALHAGEVSVPEVVEAAIARVTAADAALGTIAYAAYDRARVEAHDPRGGFFAGVPTVVKDNVDVEGMPTMHGTDAWQGRPARRDGDFARMYLATGLIPLGKSRLSEYGFSPAAEHARLGPVRSPWSTDHVAGASSAGSAALVASGALPIAHANDGGGRSASRPRSTAWWGSSPRGGGSPRTRSSGRCRSASSPTASSPAPCATPPPSSARPSSSTAR